VRETEREKSKGRLRKIDTEKGRKGQIIKRDREEYVGKSRREHKYNEKVYRKGEM
jgi:hypothetical protein